MQYIEFARKQKSSKKLTEIITSVLRLHPTKSELWIYAAKYVMEERDDMVEARAYMQRGLRFCKDSKNIWLEYAKLEMTYVAKIATRGRVLGLNQDRSTKRILSGQSDHDLTNEKLTFLDTDFQAIEFIDQPILEKLEALPVVSGAIPIAIFDAAMKQFRGDATVGEAFFNMVAEFHVVSHTATILLHITNSLLNMAPSSPAALSCFIRQPLIGIGTLSAEFPVAFGVVLDRLNSTMQDLIPFKESEVGPSSRNLFQKIIKWMLSFLSEDLDPDIAKVIAVTLRKLWTQYQSELEQDAGSGSGPFADLFTCLQEKGFGNMVSPSKSLALRLWPHDPVIQSLQNEGMAAC